MEPIWLNIDLGELDGEPPRLLELADGANVACGGHAGTEQTMRDLAARCLSIGRRLGAHPSYPDRNGFGRRSLSLTPQAIAASVASQLEALADIATSEGARIAHVKLHGALYHDANRDEAVANAIIERIGRIDPGLVIVGPPTGALHQVARAKGMAYAREGFADRGVRTDGSLIARGEPGAMITEPERVRERVAELVASGSIDTICVHGDSPEAVAIAEAARQALDAESAS